MNRKQGVSLVVQLVSLGLAVSGDALAKRPPSMTDVVDIALMRPSSDTYRKWVMDFESAPRAYSEPRAQIVQAAGGALYLSEQEPERKHFDLLDHLEYDPKQRNQGTCGNCWAWAATGAMEIALSTQTRRRQRLSTQFFTSCRSYAYADFPEGCCAGSMGDFVQSYRLRREEDRVAIPWSDGHTSFQDQHTVCGDPSAVHCDDVSREGAIPIEAMVAETITTQKLVLPGSVADQASWFADIRNDVSQATAIENIKNVLEQEKGVIITMRFTSDEEKEAWVSFWSTEPESKIWDFDGDRSCGSIGALAKETHIVLIVGYDDRLIDDNGDPNEPHWIVLNSMGQGGDDNRPNGIFRMKMNMNYGCFIKDVDRPLPARMFQSLDVKFGNLPGKNFSWSPVASFGPRGSV